MIAPNPKTGGASRWAYLAAWAYAEKAPGGNAERPRLLSQSFTSHVPVLDSSGRGSSITFTKRGLGDVLLNWENEALLALKQPDGGQYQIVYPSRSILAEPPVALVDANVDRHGTRKAAEAFLIPLHTRGAGDRSEELLSPARSAGSGQVPQAFPEIALARSTGISAAGPRPRPPISPMAACSTRSTSPENDNWS